MARAGRGQLDLDKTVVGDLKQAILLGDRLLVLLLLGMALSGTTKVLCTGSNDRI